MSIHAFTKKRFLDAITISVVVFVAACGGGGGGSTTPSANPVPISASSSSAVSSSSSSSNLAASTIVFSQTGPITLAIGSSVTNSVSGDGTGAVGFTSGNPAIATVDSSGTVALVGLGTATITATKDANSLYQAASASYQVSSTVAFTAWVGSNDTLLDFPATANGMDLYRSRTINCDLSNFQICEYGQVNSLSGSSVTDTATTINNVSYLTLRQGTRQATRALSASHFPTIFRHQVVSYKNKLWLIGGRSEFGDTNAVWSSTDGNAWKLETNNAAFPVRADHQVAVFNNKLWVVGGHTYVTSDVSFNDVWSSSDGITWNLETDNASFSPRYLHQLVVFGGKLWLIGGTTGTGPGDVWSSDNGINWTLATANAGFDARGKHLTAVLGNKLLLIDDTYQLWSSTDGLIWNPGAKVPPAINRMTYQLSTFQNKLWITGGTSISAPAVTNPKDIWSSLDGVRWTMETADAAFGARLTHQVVNHNNKLFLIGGLSDGGQKDDVWKSDNGISWRKIAGRKLPATFDHQMTSFNGKLWIIGGNGDGYSKNDVHSSDDGINWTEELRQAAFPGRHGHQVTVFNNKLWVIGGDTGVQKSDVWSSIDGKIWVQETSNAAFSARYGHQVIVFKNKLWLTGGVNYGPNGSSSFNNDIWSSTNGIDWSLEAVSANFSPRFYFQVVVFNNQLWLIGGGDGTFKNDTWRSLDGVNWTQQTSSASFAARQAHQVKIFGGQMWLTGGIANTTGSNSVRVSDVWSSPDGIAWTQQTANASFGAVTHHQVAMLNGRLWMTGGIEDPNYMRSSIWSSSDGATWRKVYSGTFEPD